MVSNNIISGDYVCICLSVCINHIFVRTITYVWPVQAGNFDQKCKTLGGGGGFTFKVKFALKKVKIYTVS